MIGMKAIDLMNLDRTYPGDNALDGLHKYLY